VNTTPALVRPFAWASLPPVSTSEAALLRDARQWAVADTDVDALERAATGLLESQVRVVFRRAEVFRPQAAFSDEAAFSDAIGVMFRTASGGPSNRGFLVDVERELAASVVARAVRRIAPEVVGAAAPFDPALAGAFAAVLVATARRARPRDVLRVSNVGPSVVLAGELAGAEPELVQVSFTVRIESQSFAARVVVPRAACRSAVTPPLSSQTLEKLGPTPLSMPIVACTTRARAADIGLLRPGDAFMPGAWPLLRSGPCDLRGLALLAPPDADVGLRVELAGDGRVVLAGGVEALIGTEEGMDELESERALLDAVGEVPVIVRVEVGEARMTAREWAALGTGDVIGLGRRPGEFVLLRIGGVAIARGELVDIDGEIGVRVGERLAGGRGDP
jgi:type III secretion protein Q